MEYIVSEVHKPIKKVKLIDSPYKNKKYQVIFSNDKKVNFGAKNYNDYIIYYKNKGKEYADKRKELYINRHEKNEEWNNYYTPGFWSRWLLWNKSTIKQSCIDIKKKFNIKISLVNKFH